MEFDVNIVSVLMAAIAGMVIGLAWYSRFLFGNAWMKLMGFSKEQVSHSQKDRTKSITLGFVAQFVTAYVLSYFVSLSVVAGNVGSLGVIKLAFLLWLGFVATTFVSAVLWEGRSWKLYLINSTYHLVAISVMAWILSVT